VIVVDASVLANALGDDADAGTSARARLAAADGVAAPDLVDVETMSVLRRAWLRDAVTDERFESAVDGLLTIPVRRYPTAPLMRRVFELRANVTAYDACYVALAEGLRSTLVTADARLAAAPTIRCDVELLAD
jgi:predicted nucleic acid-binding protein